MFSSENSLKTLGQNHGGGYNKCRDDEDIDDNTNADKRYIDITGTCCESVELFISHSCEK